MIAYISKLLYAWLLIGPSDEHHHTTQTSKFKEYFLKGASAVLNAVLNVRNSIFGIVVLVIVM